MSTYNRETIIKSHLRFWRILHNYCLNKLIKLFDDKTDGIKITKYIEDERKLRGLDMSGVKIVSYVY